MLLISSPSAAPHTRTDDDTCHLSLSFVAQRFLRLARQGGVAAGDISLPDLYRSPASRRFLPGAEEGPERLTHLCVASWDCAQQLFLAERNILHLSWEQPAVSDPSCAAGFKNNMLDTLKVYDKIWACADFVNAALQRQGLSSLTFPTPICAPREDKKRYREVEQLVYTLREAIFSPVFNIPGEFIRGEKYHAGDWKRLLALVGQARQNGGASFFLTQGNMGDARKNILAVLLGFSLFAAENPRAVLLVNTHRTMRSIYAELGPHVRKFFGWGPWGNKNIFIIPANLDEEEQSYLYDMADYYVCCPIAEGQNIPLQEAIQHNCYPVSPLHTAMSEYLDAGLVAEIESRPVSLPPLEYCNAPLPEYIGHISDPLDIADACQRAVDTDEETKRRHIRTLQQEYLNKYTYELLATRLEEALEA